VRERLKESVCESERETERDRVCVRVRERLSERVCVSEREIERERESV